MNAIFSEFLEASKKLDNECDELRRGYGELKADMDQMRSELTDLKKRLPKEDNYRRRSSLETSSEQESSSPLVDPRQIKSGASGKQQTTRVPARQVREPYKPAAVIKSTSEGSVDIAHTPADAMEQLERKQLLACYLACLLDWNELHSKTYFPLMQRIQRKTLPKGIVAHGKSPELWLLLQSNLSVPTYVYRVLKVLGKRRPNQKQTAAMLEDLIGINPKPDGMFPLGLKRVDIAVRKPRDRGCNFFLLDVEFCVELRKLIAKRWPEYGGELELMVPTANRWLVFSCINLRQVKPSHGSGNYKDWYNDKAAMTPFLEERSKQELQVVDADRKRNLTSSRNQQPAKRRARDDDSDNDFH